jgi:hypothetical protein
MTGEDAHQNTVQLPGQASENLDHAHYANAFP